MFFLSDNFRPGIHAEQSVHAQEQAEVATQFHLSADQCKQNIHSPRQHLAEDGCVAQVDHQPGMFDDAFT